MLRGLATRRFLEQRLHSRIVLLEVSESKGASRAIRRPGSASIPASRAKRARGANGQL